MLETLADCQSKSRLSAWLIGNEGKIRYSEIIALLAVIVIVISSLDGGAAAMPKGV